MIMFAAPPVVVPVYTGGGSSGPMPHLSELFLFAFIVLFFIAVGVFFRWMFLDDAVDGRAHLWFRAGVVLAVLCTVSFIAAIGVDVFNIGPQPGDATTTTTTTGVPR